MIVRNLLYYNRKKTKFSKRDMILEYSLLKKYLYSHLFVYFDLINVFFYEKRNKSTHNSRF